jgi:transcriptional regulator with XRE-family HTH domain
MAAASATPEISSERRALGDTLRSLRVAAGLDQRELARRAGWTQPKVSRLENGRTVPSSDDIAAWVRAVGADKSAQAELAAQAERVATEVTAWRTLFSRGYGLKQRQIEELERESKVIYNFAPSIIPGPLQTAEYARRAFRTWNPEVSDTAVADYVDARLSRQQLLYDPSRMWVFIVTEGALRWRPGPPEVLRAQLGQLRSLATLENVKLGIVPFAQEAPTLFMHSFVLYEREGETLVTIETFVDELDVQDASKIQAYRDVLERLRAGALWDDDAIAFLDTIIAEGGGQGG